MFAVSKKNKIILNLLVWLGFFVFCIPTTNAAGPSLFPTPVPAPGVGVGIPTAPGYPVMDKAVQANSSFIVTNTYSIASILAGTVPGYTEEDNIMIRIGRLALKQVLRNLTESIVAWIDNGFNGNPTFITDTNQFLQDTADQTVGAFLLSDPALNFLCDPFKIQVKLALGFTYQPFKENIQCSFTSALGNVNDAYNSFVNGDFIAGGGWDSWLKLTTEPQNNQMGAMMIAQGELDARLEGSTHQAELEANWGQGFLSWKDCPVAQPGDPNFVGPVQPGTTPPRDPSVVVDYHSTSAGCTIKTPGSAIVSMVGWADSSDVRQLEISNDIDAIFNAAFNQLLQSGVSIMSGSGLLGAGKPKTDTSYEDYMAYLSQQQTLLTAQNSALTSGATTPNNTGNFNTPTNTQTINSTTYSSKSNAQALVTSLIGTETQFLTNQNDIYKILDDAQKSFTNAINSPTCSDTDKAAIQDNVIKQITGDYAGPKYLFWNKLDVARATSTATINISALNNASSSISVATTDAQAQTIIQNNVASLQDLYTQDYVNSFAVTGSNAPGSNTTIITNWIDEMKGAYNSATCPVQ